MPSVRRRRGVRTSSCPSTAPPNAARTSGRLVDGQASSPATRSSGLLRPQLSTSRCDVRPGTASPQRPCGDHAPAPDPHGGEPSAAERSPGRRKRGVVSRESGMAWSSRRVAASGSRARPSGGLGSGGSGPHSGRADDGCGRARSTSPAALAASGCTDRVGGESGRAPRDGERSSTSHSLLQPTVDRLEDSPCFGDLPIDFRGSGAPRAGGRSHRASRTAMARSCSIGPDAGAATPFPAPHEGSLTRLDR